MNKNVKEIFKRWLPLAFVITMFAGLVYGVAQQSYRQSANDPQIQMAEDGATAVTSGVPLQSIVGSTTINIAQSLALYMVIYDASGKPIAGTGLLHGSLPSLPAGVFSYTASHGEDKFTWQPSPGIRSAVVITAVNGGSEFVMAGRSLREVEDREDALEFAVGIAWIIALLGSLLIEAFLSFR